MADRGYFDGEQLLACDEAGITTFAPKPLRSVSKAKGRFSKKDFVYLPEEDVYRCLAGEKLTWRHSFQQHGKTQHRYLTTACPDCPLKEQCTTAPMRRIGRWEHETVMEAAQRRLDLDPEMMTVRRCTAEHPFGTLKSWMGATHFLRRTKDKVDAEMSLFVLAYNIKRMIKIMGIKPLLEAVRAHGEALSTSLCVATASTSQIGRFFAFIAVTIPKTAPDQLQTEAPG